MNKFENKLILVIDDDPMHVLFIVKTLEKFGFRTSTARSGKLGIKCLENEIPALILLDIVMHEMDGYETCRRIKKVERWKNIPIIFLSVSVHTEHLLEGFAAGGTDYITKPFKGEELNVRIRNHIELAESQRQLKMYADHLQYVREEERLLLAREIHDELGQMLIALKIDMGMLKQYVLKRINEKYSDEVSGKFEGLSGLVDNTIHTVRKIMTELRSDVLDMLGFTDAVKQHLKGFQDRYKIQCEFENSGNDIQIDSQQSVALFRIIQEALNNVIKHANATEVKITVKQKEGTLLLEIKDNGIGFNEHDKKAPDSYGLIGMKERVSLLDGEFAIVSGKDIGTTIRITMPMRA